MKPYAILSDQHCHHWNQFSVTNKDGVNSRLQIILDEMLRAAQKLKELGGDTMFFAGDLFHVRGSIDPEVFNPTHATLKAIKELGIEIHAIPGNHDLKSRETTELGNAIQSLDGTVMRVHARPVVINLGGTPEHNVLMVPWEPDTANLMDQLTNFAGSWDTSNVDVIIHAPTNGVLEGNMPEHGLNPADLAKIGFKRIFSGHFHNYKALEDGKVFSIGATTQHTWGDVGTKAGFLVVDRKDVKWFASHAPSFVDVNPATSDEDIVAIADGNYVRVRGFEFDATAEKEFKDELRRLGARGTLFETRRSAATTRTVSVAAKMSSIDGSIDTYIEAEKDKSFNGLDAAILSERCRDILTRARSVAV